MPRVAAIEHALRDVDPRPRHVRLVVDIPDRIDRPAVNSHPQLNVRLLLQGFASFERTAHRLFRTAEEKERHPVSGRHSNEFAACFCRTKRLRSVHDLVQLLQQFNLLVDQEF